MPPEPKHRFPVYIAPMREWARRPVLPNTLGSWISYLITAVIFGLLYHWGARLIDPWMTSLFGR